MKTNEPKTDWLRLTFWYARADLFRPGGRFTTWINIGLVALVTMLTLWSLGLFFGYERLQRGRILSDPLQLAVWIGDPRIEEAAIATEQLDSLRMRLDERLAPDAEIRGLYPFREIRFEWFMLAAGFEDYSTELRGRTINDGDPLLRSRPAERGTTSDTADAEGVVVTPRMLDELGLPDGSPLPKSLVLRLPSGMPHRVPLLGVTAAELPLGQRFVFTETYWRELIATEPDVSTLSIFSGSIPNDWPTDWFDETAIPADVARMLETYDLLPPRMVEDDDGRRLAFQSFNPDGLRLSIWTVYLQQIHDAMTAADYSPSETFAQPRPQDSDTAGADPSTEIPETYDWAVVYVYDAAHLRPVVETVSAAGIAASDTAGTIERLEKLGRYSRQGMVLLGAIISLIVLVSSAGVGAIQMLRAQQKQSEIGMLKTIGMTAATVRLIYALQALIVWMIGTTIAIVIAIPTGVYLFGPKLLAESADEASRAFYLSGSLLAGVVSAAALVCLATTLWATSRVVRRPPIETVTVN